MVGFNPTLPDCRAYEQVSPTEKEGGSGGVLKGSGLALPTGSAITYTGEPFYHAKTKENESKSLEQYTSERTSNGWTTVNSNTFSPENIPPVILPAVTAGTEPQVLEETPTGSKVFFLDEADLIHGVSNPAPGEPDLYEYNTLNQNLTDLTADPTEHPDARGILGVGGEGTEEGSYIYFVAGALLTPNAHTGGCTENGGQGTGEGAAGTGCNLYLRHNSITTFIATLAPKDEIGVRKRFPGEALLDWNASPSVRTAEVSPSGRYLAFGSNFALTGEGSGGTPEVFRYDAAAQSIMCASCGGPPGGEAVIQPSVSAQINGAGRERYMLDNGRVFFTTAMALVPQDTNHQDDVYEWETDGVHLISGGTSEASPGAQFADTSTNGSDIFFTTNQSLVPQDQDHITDLYDAREDGGFPQAPPPSCPIAAACPGAVAAPPVVPSTPSLNNTTLEPPGLSVNTVSLTTPKATNAQLLAAALRTCGKDKKKARRLSCEKTARRTYAPKTQRSPKKAGSKKATTKRRNK